MSSQLHALAVLPPKERARGTHWLGDWVRPTAGLDDMGKRKFLTLPGRELQPLGRFQTVVKINSSSLDLNPGLPVHMP
jgi:hypothetical protein